MKSVRLVASDMDHTLLTSDGALPPNFPDDLRRLNEAGIVFVAASGRPLYTLKTMFPSGDGIAYISDNGAMVTYRDQVLFQSLLPVPAYQAMIARTMAETSGVPIVCGVDSAYVGTRHREHEEYLRRFHSIVTFVDDLTAVDALADKFTVYFHDRDSRNFYDRVYAPAFGRDFSVTVGGPAWVDIMNPGVNKGNGLLVLAEHLGLGHDQLMAFGDTDNDLEMLGSVYHSYAVSNADDAVHEVARFATASNDDHGVVQIIRTLLAEQEDSD